MKQTTHSDMLAIDRLVLFIKTIEVSNREFEKRIGVANGYIGNQLKRRGSVSSSILHKILLVYPELNITWLLTGHKLIIPRNSTLQQTKSNTGLRASA